MTYHCHRRGSYISTRWYWTALAARYAGLAAILAIGAVVVLGAAWLGVVVVRGW